VVVVVYVARRNCVMKFVLAIAGCACVVAVVHDTPNAMAAVVPVPGNHSEMEFPKRDGCTVESIPDGPMNAGKILPALLNAYRTMLPENDALGM
jgi:hypothetical protein